VGAVNMNLAIISHTEHYYDKFGKIKGFEPTIREIEKLNNIFNFVYHVAPIYPGEPPKNFVYYNQDNIKLVPLKPSGGKSIFSKLKIIRHSFHNLMIIHKICREVDRIQFRSPTSSGLYVLPYLKWFNKKKYWVKYAGNWNQIDPPVSYFLQRFWLNNVLGKTIVTINGKWLKQKPHILSFENPCYSEQELFEANKMKKVKNFSNKIDICFVGALKKEKGGYILIDALKLSKQYSKIRKIYFVGEGNEKQKIKSSAKKLTRFTIDIKGSLSRKKLNEVYSKCHIIILPSKSEGFPKVIAEAISFGCVPIVTNVGSICQYIDKTNGVILKERSQYEIKKAIDFLINDRVRFKKISEEGSKLAKLFTYENYNRKIRKYIIDTK
jgi:glycosyltransferase involved in cell wall biosynthesis